LSTLATIEARMTSTRLPGKVLLEAAGKPLLEHMVERLRRARTLDGIVVATTTEASSDPIAELARRLGIGCFRGSEDDVLARVLGAAQAHGIHLGWVVQIYNATEALANLIHPFWMLPLVGILGLKARDIVGYSMLQFVVHVPLVLFLVWILNYTLVYVPPVVP
jgi:hypothetical protein